MLLERRIVHIDPALIQFTVVWLRHGKHYENNNCVSVLLCYVVPFDNHYAIFLVHYSKSFHGWSVASVLSSFSLLSYGRDGVSNHQSHDCLLNRLFRRSSNKSSKLRVTGLCDGNSPVSGEFPTQRASNAENVSIWGRHHIHARKSITW